MTQVLVPLAEGCEELEAVTIIDLLRRAGVVVVSAGLVSGPVRASRGVMLVPDQTLDEALADSYDMVVLPGGAQGAERLARDHRILPLLREMIAAGKYVAAICAAPKVLAEAGLLAGKMATSYPGFLKPAAVPGLMYLEQPVVRDGPIITSRGPGTAMDFSLALIEILLGPEQRHAVEAALQRS
ncbi:MAG: DJ-1 family glyoxalase III [Pseudomonadota bacterium]|nr:DJ-1 family glyoxalase III [Pseudomonadota bacterium]